MNGSLCGRIHSVYRISVCVCSLIVLCAVGVDMISQPPRRSEGSGALGFSGQRLKPMPGELVSGN